MDTDRRIRVSRMAYMAIKRMAKEEKRSLKDTLELAVLAREIHVRGKGRGE